MTKNYLVALAAISSAFFATSCNDDVDNNVDNIESETTAQNYIIAASSNEATYLLQSDRLHEGEQSIVRTGLEVESATAWVFYKEKYAYRLVYNQGNAGVGSSYMLDNAGKLKERNIKFEISNRFTTYGVYGSNIITAASGATSFYDEGNDLPKYGVTFTIIDPEAQTLSTKTVVTENLVGNGEYFTVSGIVESDGKLYTGLCPQGLSAYGASINDGEYVLDESLLSSGAISATQHPDKVWVAIYKDMDLDNPTIIEDDRISYATSRYRSQFYQTIAADASGDIYVFSASNAKSYEGIQKTTKPSGVIRIKAGEEKFDADYYCNIEAIADGRRIFKVWHVAEDYFLLQMYTNVTDSNDATESRLRLAIFKAGDKSFRWVEEGLPALENLSSFGTFPFVEGGLAYMPVVTIDGAQPAIYVIDPVSATASKGMTIDCSSISAVGKLK